MTEVADRAEVLRSFLREQTAKKDDAQEKEPSTCCPGALFSGCTGVQ